MARGTHARGKFQRFTDFERWEMNVILGAVYDIPTITFVDLFGDERVVENISKNIVIVSAVVG